MVDVIDKVGNLANLRLALGLARQPIPNTASLNMMKWRDSISGEWLPPFLYALCVQPGGPKLDLADLFSERPATWTPRTRKFYPKTRTPPAQTQPPVVDPFADATP
jgi:hypothetical protein